LDSQGILASVEKWRGIELFNMVFTAAIAVGRFAYLMGVGGDKAADKKRV